MQPKDGVEMAKGKSIQPHILTIIYSEKSNATNFKCAKFQWNVKIGNCSCVLGKKKKKSSSKEISQLKRFNGKVLKFGAFMSKKKNGIDVMPILFSSNNIRYFLRVHSNPVQYHVSWSKVSVAYDYNRNDLLNLTSYSIYYGKWKRERRARERYQMKSAWSTCDWKYQKLDGSSIIF